MKLSLLNLGNELKFILRFRVGKKMFNPTSQVRTDAMDDIIKAKEKRNVRKNKRLAKRRSS